VQRFEPANLACVWRCVPLDPGVRNVGGWDTRDSTLPAGTQGTGFCFVVTEHDRFYTRLWALEAWQGIHQAGRACQQRAMPSRQSGRVGLLRAPVKDVRGRGKKQPPSAAEIGGALGASTPIGLWAASGPPAPGPGSACAVGGAGSNDGQVGSASGRDLPAP